LNNNKKYYQTLLFLLSFLIIHSTFSIATVRYVSKTGNSTPPYLTWETAADSIQKCINISVFGDTIYVANGVYQEQVVMIPGLSLIGAGSDSCIINTQTLVNSTGFVAVEVKDSCLIKGFQIIVYYNSQKGYGIAQSGNSKVEENFITTAAFGMYIGYTGTKTPVVTKNIINKVSKGVDIFNSSVRLRNNIISTDPNSQAIIIVGINVEAFTNDYTPIIDSNFIQTNFYGIYKFLGANPIISNNIIVMNGGRGITIQQSDSAKVFNNGIINSGYAGIDNNSFTNLLLYNNYIKGEFGTYGIKVGSNSIVKNNVVTNKNRGIGKWGSQDPIVHFNNSWSNTINYDEIVPDTTNLSVDPMIVNDDTTQGDLDFRLQMYSPLIDAGDPTILDRDGSRSDIGLYGGPYGWTYTYEDLAPRPPHNVTAVIEEGFVKLTWNKNTEADFSHYRIYRDTVTILIYDSTKMIAETPDTFYYDQLPPVNHETRFYYVITAFDNQGNQSYPSEEINVLVTGLGEHPPKGYDGYRLLANYPNPFNPSTIIPYRLKERGHVRLSIYDLKGELVRILVNEWQERGYYEVVFQPNAEDKSKITKFEVMMGKTYSHMSSGMYIYSIQVIDERNIPVFTDSEKMILLK
jgi:parallel beta-helix repeat protein